MRKQQISLWVFKNIIRRCWSNMGGAKGARVMFLLGDKELKLKRIGQWGVIPDVIIELQEPKEVK